jgi:hypothetical protein
METKRTNEFRADAVRIALASGLARVHVASDLGIGLSTQNKKMFDSSEDARRKLAVCRYDNVRPHSSLGNRTPAEALGTLEQFDGSAPAAFAQSNDEQYDIPSRTLSLWRSEHKGVGQAS